MTIEVRQLLIRSSVGDAQAAPAPGAATADDAALERLKQELLALFRSLVDEKFDQQRER